MLCGKPGYINFLDALNGWQLVSELKRATGLAAATSFKHVSPAGAAVGACFRFLRWSAGFIGWMIWMWSLRRLPTHISVREVRSRMSSFGDFISLSDVCDRETALVIKREVSRDIVIAPGYTEEDACDPKGKEKRQLQRDPDRSDLCAKAGGAKEVFGITFEQGRNELVIDEHFFDHLVTENKELPQSAKIDLAIAMITLKFTQSNSVSAVC